MANPFHEDVVYSNEVVPSGQQTGTNGSNLTNSSAGADFRAQGTLKAAVEASQPSSFEPLQVVIDVEPTGVCVYNANPKL
jgi:hypothetical protein